MFGCLRVSLFERGGKGGGGWGGAGWWAQAGGRALARSPHAHPNRTHTFTPTHPPPPPTHTHTLLHRYGEFVVLPAHDHISVCKPLDAADPAYSRLMSFLHERVRALRHARAEQQAARADHMPPAL